MSGESRDDFQHAAQAYRSELQVHCYRILGSIHESEDAVQETMLRAWRSFESFEGRSSLRLWLYRIATNVCLNLIAKRSHAHRTLPEQHGSPALEVPNLSARTDIAWLDPYPDAALESIADTSPGPQARYEPRRAVKIAHLGALQNRTLPGGHFKIAHLM
jgi:RNA polymerase sigma-70 factor (ECF subfamily)